MENLIPALLGGILVSAGGSASCAAAKSGASLADIAGTYEPLPIDFKSGALKSTGLPVSVKGLPAPANAEAVDLLDPARLCMPIGPFRMIAEMKKKMEIVPTDKDVILIFEEKTFGLVRVARLEHDHNESPPGFQGDSVAQWEGGSLLIDTVGFNDVVWLTPDGARHGPSLRLREKITPLQGGLFLRYEMTAEDPAALPKPYTYVRIFRKTSEVIQEHECVYNIPTELVRGG
ncbi:MAG: hypothetical protein QM696_01030 [Steroidobacteraceae bacterium]